MGLYQRWVLPRLLDLVLRNKEATRFRARLVPRAHGTTLELIAAAGFRFTRLDSEYAKGPRPMSYVYIGRARPA